MGVLQLGQSWGMEKLHLCGRAEGVQTRQGGLDQGRTARGGREGLAPRSPWLPTSLHLPLYPSLRVGVAFEGREVSMKTFGWWLSGGGHRNWRKSDYDVCLLLGRRVDLFLGHGLCGQKMNTERTSFSQGHIVGGGGGGHRSPGFAAESHSSGSGGGCCKSPQEFPVRFPLRGTRWVKEKWVGYRRALGGRLHAQGMECQAERKGAPLQYSVP